MRETNVITVLLLVIVSVPLAYGQDNRLLKVLEPVDEKQRPRLAERLKLFIEYHRTQQWGKLFKLIDNDNAKRKSSEAFAREMAGMGHLDFVPERVEAEDPSYGSQYRIHGCVKARTDRGVIWFQGGLVAYLQAGDWYFTPYFLAYGRSTSPLPCANNPQSGKGG